MRRSLIPAIVALLTVAAPIGQAWARDICVQDNFGEYWRFRRVGSLSGTGKIVPLSGVKLIGTANAAVDGTAVKLADGTVNIGLFVHSMTPPRSNFTVTLRSDMNFSGGGFFDSNGDYLSDGAISFSNADCSSIPTF